MTTRDQTKKVLVNEFVDPITMGIGLGGAALAAYGLYSGAKKGTGARFRIGQHLSKLTDIGSKTLDKVVTTQALQDTEKWHRKVAERYGPGVKYAAYRNSLLQHNMLQQIAPDREDLKKKFDTAEATRANLAKIISPVIQRKNAVISAGGNISTELFDPANPSLGTVEQHHKNIMTKYEPKNVDIHGNALASGAAAGSSLFDVIQSRSNPYTDPLGMTHNLGGKRDLTIGDVVDFTDLEKMDAANPDAAEFRKKVTSSIIEPKAAMIGRLQQSGQGAAQRLSQHFDDMKQDREKQSQDLEFSRAALPSPFDVGISKWERVKRAAKKVLRNKATDTIRSNIG